MDDYRGLNANMHTVEVFLAVADVAKKEEYRVRAGRIIAHVIGWARLITQWALSTYKDDKKQRDHFIQAAENLFDRAIRDAWNADEAPGIVYTTGWDGKPIVRDRMHWTLAEAINTSAVLYRVTKKEKYAEFMQYLDEKVLDHVNGSWFHQLDCNNNVIGTVWPGKSDLYHAVQATLIPYYSPEVSIALAVKKGFSWISLQNRDFRDLYLENLMTKSEALWDVCSLQRDLKISVEDIRRLDFRGLHQS